MPVVCQEALLVRQDSACYDPFYAMRGARMRVVRRNVGSQVHLEGLSSRLVAWDKARNIPPDIQNVIAELARESRLGA